MTQGLALTIYIPTYRRRSLRDLLHSIAPMSSCAIEVVVSDNDPDHWSEEIVNQARDSLNCEVEYSARVRNIGGDANILRGLVAGSAPWLWIIGDDDEILPGAIDLILQEIVADTTDRIILLSDYSPRATLGLRGTLALLAQQDPALILATTLVSANVMRRSAIDLAAAVSHLDSSLGHAWSYRSLMRCSVLPHPAIRVGISRVTGPDDDEGAARMRDAFADLLRSGYGLDLELDAALSWNFVSVQGMVDEQIHPDNGDDSGLSFADPLPLDQDPEETLAIIDTLRATVADRDRLAALALRLQAERDDALARLITATHRSPSVWNDEEGGD